VKHTRLFALAAALAAAAIILASCAGMPRAGQSFHATLAAAQGATTQAKGEATFQLSADGTSLAYTIKVTNLVDVNMAHIHVAAAPRQAGDVVAWLYPEMAPPVLKPGSFTGVLAQGSVTAAGLTGPLAGMTLQDLLDRIGKGLAYVNVHTRQYPGGEISGVIGAAGSGAASEMKSSRY
jgi:hypothetical protein